MKFRNIITKSIVCSVMLGYIYTPSVNAFPLFNSICQVFSIVSGQSESRKQHRLQREHIIFEKKDGKKSKKVIKQTKNLNF